MRTRSACWFFVVVQQYWVFPSKAIPTKGQGGCSSICHSGSKKTLSNSRVETKASSFLLSPLETFDGSETLRCKLRKTDKTSKQHQQLDGEIGELLQHAWA
jgi:hypothetical protein